MHKTLLVLISLLVLTIALPNQNVYACGGEYEPISLNTSIETSDYLVKATVVQADDTSQNVIIEAISYLFGGNGPRYLLLYRNDPALSSVYYKHAYDTGCTYGGVNPVKIGTIAFFAVKRTTNGSYITDTWWEDRKTYQLPLRVYVQKSPLGNDETDNLNQIWVDSEDQFIDLVAKVSKEKPVEPQKWGDLPLLSPIRVVTDKGKQYLFPVDRSAPVEQEAAIPQLEWSPIAYPDLFYTPRFCAELGCRLSVPDLSLYATQVEKNVIHVQYLPYAQDIPIVLEGDAFSFSPTSEAMVVWTGDKMTVYMISNRPCECSFGPYLPYLYPAIKITLSYNNKSALYGKVFWSADGTTFTYGDSLGTWVMDLFRQDEPELVVAADKEIPEPLLLSETGRYLAYTFDRQEWITLDRLSGKTYHNVIISPDERNMVQIGFENDIPSKGDILGCPIPLIEGCHVNLVNLKYFGWVSDQLYFYALCKPNNNIDCDIGFSPIGYKEPFLDFPMWPLEESIKRLGDVDFEPHQQILAFVSGAKTLYLNHEEYDLSNFIDGDITDIEWMPSLFYFEHP